MGAPDAGSTDPTDRLQGAREPCKQRQAKIRKLRTYRAGGGS